jgi:nicotinate-nucleotide pyrophosphorylase (carboxylating)
MDSAILRRAFKKHVESFLEEDDLSRNMFYAKNLPAGNVECFLKIKSELLLAGLPFFIETIDYLLSESRDWSDLEIYEGKQFKNGDVINMGKLPFGVVLTAERIALNLLQRASSIATFTQKFVQFAKSKQIAILDTRKTTPGLRWLEKYAVRVGGGFNHRLGQTDAWMVKDNHKNFFGGLENAIQFFKSMNSFYNPLIVEIHSLLELKEAMNLDIKHVMLDNFSPEMIKEAVALKKAGVTFEVSGGIRLENIESYLISGVDAISVGALTYDAPAVDISFKYEKKERIV